MRAVVQRVTSARVAVDGLIIGEIGLGLLVLLGAACSDDQDDVDYVVRKFLGLRIFQNSDGKMDRSVAEVNGAVMVVSQFTLYGDVRKGRRPSFDEAAPPESARCRRRRPRYRPVVAGPQGRDPEDHRRQGR